MIKIEINDGNSQIKIKINGENAIYQCLMYYDQDQWSRSTSDVLWSRSRSTSDVL